MAADYGGFSLLDPSLDGRFWNRQVFGFRLLLKRFSILCYVECYHGCDFCGRTSNYCSKSKKRTRQNCCWDFLCDAGSDNAAGDVLDWVFGARDKFEMLYGAQMIQNSFKNTLHLLVYRSLR